MILKAKFEKQGNFLFRYRGIIPVFLLLAVIATFLNNELHLSEDVFLNYFCLFISFIGFIIRALVVGNTPTNTSGRNTKKQIADTLNTTGVYSIVRHPLYLGNFFMWFGIALLTINLWFVMFIIVLYWYYYERIMFAEEKFLISKFGKTYSNWAEKTPAVIPNFRNYTSSKISFSWKKVIKKEKNGIAAIFLIFWLLITLNDYLKHEEFILKMNFWTIAMIASCFLYLILKTIKNKTSWLDEKGR